MITLVNLSANADVFDDYNSVGSETLALAKKAETPNDLYVQKTKELTTLGYQIMDLYQVKYTECVDQFNQLKNLDSNILNMKYAEIDSQLHEGKGLIVAPKTCYKGRSLVVHPYQIAALALENRLFTKEGQEMADHELNEVIVRAQRIKKELGL